MGLNLSIVIPTCSQLSMLEECVESIKRNTVGYEIIIVVNSEDDNFHEAVDKLKSNNVHVYHMPFMAGFIKACNYGIGKTIGDHICILNDDTVVGLKWAYGMLNRLYGDVHQVGPSLRFLDDDFGATDKCTKKAYLEGWCFIITRDIYEAMGMRLFDENLKWSYCEDADLSTTIQDMGYSIAIVDANVKHHGTATRSSSKIIDNKCAKYEEINKKYLQTKWRKLKCRKQQK